MVLKRNTRGQPLEKNSEHPISVAIVQAAEAKAAYTQKKVTNFEALLGNGVRAHVDDKIVVVAKPRYVQELVGGFEEATLVEIEKLEDEGKTVVCVVIEGRFAGSIACIDTLKDGVFEAITQLTRRGIKSVLLTGDNRRTAQAIAKQAGISTVISEVLPHEKSDEIKKYHEKGIRVAMVGDGINDAPALAESDLGIALGSGTDVAMESADVVLIRSNVHDIVKTIDLSRKTITNVKQNLFWAFGYNVILIPMAAGVLHIFGGPLLSPVFAAAAMSLSSVTVVMNALRLKWVRLD